MEIMVLSPHRDDAAFSLGLAIELWLDAGHAVHVVNCFTQSNYAPFAEEAVLHSTDRLSRITALRLREDLQWKRQCGARLTLTDLNLQDAPIRLDCCLEAVCSREVTAGDNAIATIRDAVIREHASALVLPLALGGHVDHTTTREAAMLAYKSQVGLAFYEDLPYAARPGIATTIESSAQDISEELTAVFVTEETDAEAAIRRKRRAALCYSSQVDEHQVDQISRFSKRYGGRERLWADSAWRASDLGVDCRKSPAAAR